MIKTKEGKVIISYEDFKKLTLDEIDQLVDTPNRTIEEVKQILIWIRKAKEEYDNSRD